MDPLADIEDAKAHHDIGVTAYRIYRGARFEGASRADACLVVFAWYRAMFSAAEQQEEDEQE